jgi:hypothetical protein
MSYMRKGARCEDHPRALLHVLSKGMAEKNIELTSLNFLFYVHASCDETIIHLNFIRDTHDLDKSKISRLLDSYTELSGKIYRFIQYVEKEWDKDFNAHHDAAASNL